jgi:hypothetical protein
VNDNRRKELSINTDMRQERSCPQFNPEREKETPAHLFNVPLDFGDVPDT